MVKEKTALPLPAVDVRTRWSSTFKMMEQTIALREVLTSLQCRGELEEQFTEPQFELLARIVEILRPLDVATTVLQGDQSPTFMCLVAELKRIQKELAKLKGTASSMNVADSKIRLSSDKTRGMRASHVRQEETVDDTVAKFANLLWDDMFGDKGRFAKLPDAVYGAGYLNVYDDLSLWTEPEIKRGEGYLQAEALALLDESGCFNGRSYSSSFQFEFGWLADERRMECKRGIDALQHGPKLLEFWVQRSQGGVTQPLLAEIASRFLCFLASSASSERVFSVAKSITSAKRNRLSGDRVEQLAFLAMSWGITEDQENFALDDESSQYG